MIRRNKPPVQVEVAENVCENGSCEILLDLPKPHRKFPGFMPDVPEACPKGYSVIDGTTKYIDNGICANCKTRCERYKEFQKEWKTYRANRRK